MRSPLNKAITFSAMFVASKVGKTGLSPTVEVYNPAGAQIVAPTTVGVSELGATGLYQYTLGSGFVTTEGPFTAIFKTADGTVDLQHVPTQVIADAQLPSSGVYATATDVANAQVAILAEVDAIDPVVADTNSKLTDIYNGTQPVDGGASVDLTPVTTQLTTIESKVDAIDLELDGIVLGAVDLSPVLTAVANVDADVAAVAGVLGAMDTQLDSIELKVDALALTTGSVDTTLLATKAQADAIKAVVDTNGVKLTTLQGTANQIDTDVLATKAVVDAMALELADMDLQLDDIEDKVDDANTKLDALAEDTDFLKDLANPLNYQYVANDARNPDNVAVKVKKTGDPDWTGTLQVNGVKVFTSQGKQYE